MRINQYLARAGLGSRRSVEKNITEGDVCVNGFVVRDLTTKINSGDEVTFKNNRIEVNQNVYYLVNKPVGYTCSNEDRHATNLITELVPAKPKVYPVGRLDRDSSGLIILTNDGDFAYRISHPKFEHEKEYEVESRYIGNQENRDLESLMRYFKCGVRLDDTKTSPAKIKVRSKNGHLYSFDVVLKEGKNRQIRRMMEKVRFQVVSLKRVRIESYEIGLIPEGKFEEFAPRTNSTIAAAAEIHR